MAAIDQLLAAARDQDVNLGAINQQSANTGLALGQSALQVAEFQRQAAADAAAANSIAFEQALRAGKSLGQAQQQKIDNELARERVSNTEEQNRINNKRLDEQASLDREKFRESNRQFDETNNAGKEANYQKALVEYNKELALYEKDVEDARFAAEKVDRIRDLPAGTTAPKAPTRARPIAPTAPELSSGSVQQGGGFGGGGSQGRAEAGLGYQGPYNGESINGERFRPSPRSETARFPQRGQGGTAQSGEVADLDPSTVDVDIPNIYGAVDQYNVPQNEVQNWSNVSGRGGDVELTNYAYKGDTTPDSNSAKGIGNRDNRLVPGVSAAINKRFADQIGAQPGDVLEIQTSEGPLHVTYDDTVPESSADTGAVIDIYRPRGGSNNWASRTSEEDISVVARPGTVGGFGEQGVHAIKSWHAVVNGQGQQAQGQQGQQTQGQQGQQQPQRDAAPAPTAAPIFIDPRADTADAKVSAAAKIRLQEAEDQRPYPTPVIEVIPETGEAVVKPIELAGDGMPKIEATDTRASSDDALLRKEVPPPVNKEEKPGEVTPKDPYPLTTREEVLAASAEDQKTLRTAATGVETTKAALSIANADFKRAVLASDKVMDDVNDDRGIDDETIRAIQAEQDVIIQEKLDAVNSAEAAHAGALGAHEGAKAQILYAKENNPEKLSPKELEDLGTSYQIARNATKMVKVLDQVGEGEFKSGIFFNILTDFRRIREEFGFVRPSENMAAYRQVRAQMRDAFLKETSGVAVSPSEMDRLMEGLGDPRKMQEDEFRSVVKSWAKSAITNFKDRVTLQLDSGYLVPDKLQKWVQTDDQRRAEYDDSVEDAVKAAQSQQQAANKTAAQRREETKARAATTRTRSQRRR